MIKESLFKKLLLASLLILTALLFVGSPGSFDDRLTREAWETGHFSLFAIACFVLCVFSPVKNLSFGIKLLSVTIFCLVFGLGTEIAQLLVGRSFELTDIFNDFVGGYSGFIISQLSTRKKTLTNLFLVSAFFLGALVGYRGFLYALIDEQMIEQSFPVIANFEDAFDLKRWKGNRAEMIASKDFASSGIQSAKVTLQKGKWPGISLKHFIGDWSGYDAIEFDIKLPQDSDLRLELKIFDLKHPSNGYKFKDRFNQRFMLKPGINHLRFSIDDIKNAPKNRELNIEQIISLSLFTSKLKKPVTFYIDNVRLTQKE